MPHIKVKPFDLSRLDSLISDRDRYVFRAESIDGSVDMVGVVQNGDEFILEIKKRDDHYLIKSDPVSRPLDSDKIKKALKLLSKDLDMEILHSNIELNPHKPRLAETYHKKIRDFENPQFTRDKVALEVGFGSGRHLLHQAKNNPDTLYIGIEIHTPSLQQLLKQISLQGIDNIWVVDYDARLLLEMLPSNSCRQIFVHFPVPWDKKPHRRVISDRFLAESLRVLESGGELELRTDSDNYYHHALDVFSKPAKIDFRVEKNRDIAVVSKYEDRWRAQQKDIYTLTVYCQESSEPIDMNYDFSFGLDATLDKLVQLPARAEVLDGYFVHFERRYDIAGGKGMLVRCSFGSFDRPEHKYLMQTEDKVIYYPHEPVKTKANYLAHKKIGELIDG